MRAVVRIRVTAGLPMPARLLFLRAPAATIPTRALQQALLSLETLQPAFALQTRARSASLIIRADLPQAIIGRQTAPVPPAQTRLAARMAMAGRQARVLQRYLATSAEKGIIPA